MGKSKLFYVAILKFPLYTTKPFRSQMTEGQAEKIAAMLEGYKKSGKLEDYYLGPPDKLEQVHALILSADSLKAELRDVIEAEGRRSSDR